MTYSSQTIGQMFGIQVAAPKSVATIARLNELHRRAFRADWDSETRMNIYLACLELAIEAGHATVAVPVRDVSLRSGCGTKTVSLELRGFLRSGILELAEERRSEKDARVCRIPKDPLFLALDYATDSRPVLLSTLAIDSAHSAIVKMRTESRADLRIRGSGIGKRESLAVGVIEYGPKVRSARDLAVALDCSLKAAGRTLGRLRKFGLVTKSGGFYRRGLVSWEDVARKVPTAGRTAEKENQFEMERESWERVQNLESDRIAAIEDWVCSF